MCFSHTKSKWKLYIEITVINKKKLFLHAKAKRTMSYAVNAFYYFCTHTPMVTLNSTNCGHVVWLEFEYERWIWTRFILGLGRRSTHEARKNESSLEMCSTNQRRAVLCKTWNKVPTITFLHRNEYQVEENQQEKPIAAKNIYIFFFVYILFFFLSLHYSMLCWFLCLFFSLWASFVFFFGSVVFVSSSFFLFCKQTD